ncbi:MAG: CHAT domain-containing tetratricopeptide repeat protein [Chitinophagales bacterium]
MADNSLQIAEQQLQEAINLNKTALYQQAIDLLERAVLVFEKLEQWEYYLQTINEIGKNYNDLEQPSKAIEALNTALNIANKHALSNNIHLVSTYNIMGGAYSLQREYESELLAYQRAVEIALKEENISKKNALALTYTNLGAYYDERGKHAIALDFHRKALQTYLESNERKEENMATCYNNLGACYTNLGDYAQALPHFQKTLQSWLKSLPEQHPHLLYTYNNIASCHYFRNDFETAIPNFQKALEIAHHNFGESHALVAAISINVGNCYNSLQQFDHALKYYHRTTQIHKHLYDENERPPVFVFENYISLAKCFFAQEMFEKAFHYFEDALKGYQTIFGEQHPKLAEIFNPLANAFLQKGEETQAIRYFHQSLNVLIPAFQTTDIYQYPTVNQVPFSKILLFALNRKSRSFYQLYQKKPSAKNLQAAFEGYCTLTQFLEVKRQQYKALDSKLDLGEQLVNIYEKAIEVAAEISKSQLNTTSNQALQTAFHFTEKAKAVLLMAELQEADALSNIPENIRTQEEKLKKNLLEWEKKIEESKAKKEEENLLELKDKHFDTQQQYLQFIEQLERNYPDYYQLKYETKTTDIAALQQYLQSFEGEEKGVSTSSKIVLSYYVGEESVFIFEVTAKDYQVHQIAKPNHFEALVTDFLDAINAVDIDDFVETATELYAILLQPLQLEKYAIEGEDAPQLIILRHGILNYLPFDALLLLSENEDIADDFTELPYLIRVFQISYHYSATLLLHQAAKRAKNIFLEDSFLGIAPVSFNGKKQANVALASRSGKTQVLRSNRAGEEALQNLPNTENEVKAVFELFESRQLEAKIFLYASASKENLFLEAPKHKYILISTHGLTNDENAKLSGIYLAKTQTGAPNEVLQNDYLLYTSETYHLRLQADLVILSSCSSGVGKLYSAEGMMALQRGFLYAGANNIIFTQFDIPDESSSALVKRLFFYILEGNNYAAALRKAKMELLVSDAYTPQDWAGFLLIGE